MAEWVFHVDMDQFIAAVELLRRPELTGLPVVVGGDGDPTKRGVVSTASYEARKYGVGSGVALRTALKRCPHAVFLPVDRDAYEAASELVMAALRSFGVPVEVPGWDEAFIASETDRPEAFAHQIRLRVRLATRLECSVGIGQNKLQAKIATRYGKPGGVFRLTHETWFPILGAEPTQALWGIGTKTARKLAALGIHTVSDLAAADPDKLARAVGPTTGPWLVELACGGWHTRVSASPHVARSRSREITFQADIADWGEVRRELISLVRSLADEITDGRRPVRRVVVKIRFAPFFTHTHGHTLAAPTLARDALEAGALVAFDRFTEPRPVRLLGVQAEFERLRSS
jgi:DNA polymerase-4